MWFQEQDSNSIDRLYSEPYILRAILRSVSPLAQQYLLRLTFVQGPFPVSDIVAWCITPNALEHEEALSSLIELKLWRAHRAFGRDITEVEYHPGAQRLIQQFMKDSSPAGPSRPCASPEVVSEFGKEQWGKVQDFMVNPGEQLDDGSSAWIQEILVNMGVMDCREDSTGDTLKLEFALNKNGCRFLLQDTSMQLWELLLEYLGSGHLLGWTDKTPFDPHEVMALLCRLSFMDSTREYDISSLRLTPCQQNSVRDLRGCGLIYMRSDNSTTLSPTPYATGRWTTAPSSSNEKVGIIVESNFRLYMHRRDDQEGHTNEALLNLFVRIDYTLSNLCAATITRSKVCEGLNRGIGVEFMVEFMLKHAHPVMRHGSKQTPKLPSNVVHQMRLWADDFDKVKSNGSSLLIKGFRSYLSFAQCLKTLKDRETPLKKYVEWHWKGNKDDVPEGGEGVLALVVTDREGVREEVRNLLRKFDPTLQYL